MPGLWRSLALASSLLLRSVHATPEPSLDLVERASSANTSAAATWIYSGSSDQNAGNLTFSITVNPTTFDMWFRLEGPAVYSWIAIAAGSKMSDAKAYYMVYEGSKDNTITISSRGPCDHCEPAYDKNLNLQSGVIPTNDPSPYGINNDTFSMSGFVPNGTVHAGIDPTSKKQSFMFAVGPSNHNVNSNSFSAPLRMHVLHGTFQLDMTQAYGTEMPALGLKEVGVTSQGSSTQDHEIGSPVHAVLMGFGFIIVIPLGILALRVLNKVKLHMIVQGIALLLITVGWIVGFIISKTYQRSMHFNSPHQIIGIFVYLLLLAQWATGFFHHRVYQKTQQPTWMIKPHKYGLGAVVLVLGVVNVAVGFHFALSGSYNLFFVPIALGMAILLVIAITIRNFVFKKKSKANVPFGGPAPTYQAPYGSAVPPQQGGSYGPPPSIPPAPGSTWNSRSDVELGKMGPPPSYSNEATKPREMF